MMDMLEQEIIDKFYQLDKEAQKRVQTLIEQVIDSDTQHPDGTQFDYEQWRQQVEAIRQQIQAQHRGIFPTLDVVDILRDIRDGEDE